MEISLTSGWWLVVGRFELKDGNMPDLALLGVFAHPDDEQVVSGAFAQAAAEGMRTGLICATRGEMGEIADPTLATPETLGKVRESEMRAASAVLGIKHLWFLDYKDSGMMGTEANQDPGSLVQSNQDGALGRIVAIVRQFKPTVMVTFDETGGYGHPDHITMHKLATLAFDAATDPTLYPEAGEPWQTARLYYSGFPRSQMKMFAKAIEEMDLNTGFRGLDLEKFGLADEQITNELDVSEWVAVKERSVNHHKTQMDPNGPFTRVPEEERVRWRSKEHYALVAGSPLPNTPEAKQDLFAGLR
jgi:LmbE family N-acetylglucosaminyl deacetylase